MKHLFTLCILCFSLCCSAQNSFNDEKEERIKKVDFPKNAIELLKNTLPKEVKELKYYKEQDHQKSSYEAKLKYKGKKYHIEFNKEGVLEDVKVTIKAKNIKPRTLEMIKKHMYNTYVSFRLKKIQQQYQNNNSQPKKVIKNAFLGDPKGGFSYEIIAEVKKEKKRYFIEIMFTKDGDIKSVKTIF